MNRSVKISAWVLVLAFLCLPVLAGATQKSLQPTVQFLDNIQKVEWYKVEGRNIIIGWKGFPDDFYHLNYKAALNASKSTLYEVYVWSVRYPQKDWSPGEGGQICITTAQMGRFGKSNCKK